MAIQVNNELKVKVYDEHVDKKQLKEQFDIDDKQWQLGWKNLFRKSKQSSVNYGGNTQK